jgi:hypothetical protein
LLLQHFDALLRVHFSLTHGLLCRAALLGQLRLQFIDGPP